MTEPETLVWRLIAPRIASVDAATMYAEAGAAGVTVKHHSWRTCRTWESEAGQAGTFREIGWVRFNKRTRRWSVSARTDCSAVELCSLIGFGVAMQRRYGQQPRHALRGRQWNHEMCDDGCCRWVWAQVGHEVDRRGSPHRTAGRG